MLTATHAGLSQMYNAERVQMNRDLRQMNATSLLPQAWEFWDAELIEKQKQMLSLYMDLASSVSVIVPLEKEEYVWFAVSGGYGTQHTMDFDPEVPVDASEIKRVSVPLPLTRNRFGWGYRQNMNVTSAAQGNLGATSRLESIYAVMASREDQCLYGPLVGKTRVGEGLLNYTDRNTDTFSGFDLNGATGTQWRSAVLKGLEKQREANFGGEPTTLYVNDGDWLWAESTPYDSSGGMGAQSIATFIRGLGVNIVVVPKLPVNTLLFVVRRVDVVALAEVLPLMHRPEGRVDIRDPYRFVTEYGGAIAPKSDFDGNCGITTITKS